VCRVCVLIKKENRKQKKRKKIPVAEYLQFDCK